VRLTSPPRTPTAIDLKVDKTSVSKGEAVMLYGHVTQALHPTTGVAGLEVDYYKRSTDGPWIYVGKSTSVAPTGWHSITIHPLISREWKAVVVGNASYEPRTSNRLVVSPH
jgi:hypothetical protein